MDRIGAFDPAGEVIAEHGLADIEDSMGGALRQAGLLEQPVQVGGIGITLARVRGR